jgi:hypothetical protein
MYDNRVVTLWVGDSLGRVERACLASMLRQGHPVTLYCYGTVANVPAGVLVADAGEIIAGDRILRYPNGSAALFSNRFRYELMRLGRGIWLDIDIYLLKPLDCTRPYLFGYEAPGMINNAVLRIPSEAAILTRLLEPFEQRVVPSWLPWRERWKAWWRLRRDGRTDVTMMPHGATGPRALTALVRECQLSHWALPVETFYPIHYSRAEWIVAPAMKLDDIAGPGTVAVHLWNERINSFKEQDPPPGSFLERLQLEGA